MSQRTSEQGCSDFRNHLRMSRRSFLQAGALGTAGLALPDLLRSEAKAANAKSENSVIILWMRGGPSQIDLWDPKPLAPEEYRGEFGTISTNVPDIQISDKLPMCSQMMEKWSIVRSLHHKNAGHSAADQILFTGQNPGPTADQNIYPSCGSIVSEQLRHLDPELPPYVMIPRMVPGTDAAYLGVANKPFETLADPGADGPFKVPNFELADGLTFNRLTTRQSLLKGFDQFRSEIDRSGAMDALDDFQKQALEILSSDRARDAFNLDAEPAKLRERYGFIPKWVPPPTDMARCSAAAWSQRMLLSRRLVEAGVRLVTVDLRWWDTHFYGFDSLRQGFMHRFDKSYSALIEDLEQRGLLKNTLVVAWGEFGRTPRVNNWAGRDHYPHVFSAALAGGPVQGGRVVGSSDSKGAFPKANPKSPQDVLATIYRHLGVETEKHYLDPSGRPIKTLPFGNPITELA